LYKHFHYTFKWVLADVSIVIFSYTLAYIARAITTPLNYLDQILFIFFFAACIVSSSYLAGVYHRIWGQTSGHGIVILLRAFAVYSGVIIALEFLITPRPIPLSIVIFGNIFALIGFTAARYRSRLPRGIRWRWHAVWKGEFPEPQQKLLIIGAGESGEMLARRLRFRPANGKDDQYKIIGFIDDDKQKQGLYVQDFPVLGGREDIPHIVKEKQIDLLILAIHNISGTDFREILTLCEQSQAQIKIVPDLV